jgi:HAD superfamily hydrolase (TIGR01509 family)
MIRLVIFDLTNVCYTDEETAFLELFAKRHGLDPATFAGRHDTLVKRAEVAEFDGIELWRRLLEEHDLKGDPEEIIREMIALKQEKPEIIALARSLRGRVRTAYLTNYNESYWKEIVRRLDPSQHFDGGIVSFEARARKPDVRIFEALLRHFGVQPGEAVFFDDSRDNLVQAARLGIRTIHFQGNEPLKRELRAMGVLS